jgi:hypothetical protein
VNCELVCHLIDDYLENRLSPYERKSLEAHLAFCPTCGDELRSQAALERTLWQAMAAGVEGRYLSPAASARIVQEAQASVKRAVWSKRVVFASQLAASAAAVVLVLVGVLFWLGAIPIPSELNRVSLLPLKSLIPWEQQPLTVYPVDQPDRSDLNKVSLSPDKQAALSLGTSRSLIEPLPLQPSEAFTITLYLQNELSSPLEDAHFDLDITGPTGYYRFPLAVEGPLVANGVTVLEIGPEVLAEPCQEKYLISPTDIFRTPGIYVVRVILASPVVPVEQ